VIATPENDHACLDAITEEIAGRLRDRDPAIVAIAEAHPTTDALRSGCARCPSATTTARRTTAPRSTPAIRRSACACRPPIPTASSARRPTSPPPS
jgi:hypothetical protein